MLKKFICLALLVVLLSGQGFADDFVPADEDDFYTGADLFVLDADDTGADISLQFGSTLAEALQWDSANSRFKLSDSLDFEGNQIINTRLENLAAAPTCDAASAGRLYFNTTNGTTYVCDGTIFNQLDNTVNSTVEFPVVQARRTTTLVLNTTYTDVDLDTTDLENDPAVLDHDDTLRDRINIAESGMYQIIYGYTAGGTATATHEARARVRANDTTVLPGSASVNRNFQVEFSTTSASFLANLTAGDFVSLQLNRDATADSTQDDIYFSIVKLEGVKGDKGDPGSVGNGTDEVSFTLDQDNAGAGVDVSFIAEQGSDNNGEIRYNATANRWEVSNDGGAFIPLEAGDGQNDIFYAYDAVGVTLIGNVPTDMPFDTEVREDTEYTHAVDSAEVTINTAGAYLVDYNCALDVVGTARYSVEHWIERNTGGGGFTEAPGTRTGTYHRTTADGLDNANIEAYLDLAAGDIIKVVTQADVNNVVRTEPNGCRLKIERLDTGQGLIGPQGAQGPQGPAGTNGVSGGGWGDDGVTTTTALNAQIDGDLQVDGNINSDCGPSAAYWAERGTVGSNASWALGNGQTPWGSPMGCAGTVQRFAATCTGAIGTSLGAEIRVNNVSSACNLSIPASVGGVANTTCSVAFGANDIVGVYAQTEVGAWTECVGTFWVKYD